MPPRLSAPHRYRPHKPPPAINPRSRPEGPRATPKPTGFGQFAGAVGSGDSLGGQTAGYAAGTIGGGVLGAAAAAYGSKLKVGKLTKAFKRNK